MADPTFVVQVNGAKKESFLLVTMKADFNGIKHTSLALSEADSRATLAQIGVSETVIPALIEGAREAAAAWADVRAKKAKKKSSL